MTINLKLKNNIARIIGQTNGIVKMYQEGRRCADILMQISAVASSINTCTKKIFDYHIDECLKDRANAAAELDELQDMLANINTTPVMGCLNDAVYALEQAKTAKGCLEILQQFRHAYAIVIYNAGKLFKHHLSHVLSNDKDGNSSDELKEMTHLYFKMLK